MRDNSKSYDIRQYFIDNHGSLSGKIHKHNTKIIIKQVFKI